ncbi:mannose-1-phosphate guanylyltransferase [soil metagenome]
MAGGVGSRFWPVSRVNYPKQFQDLMGVGETLIQQTYHRLSTLVPLENILILTNTSYKDIVKEQLPLITEDQILLEPQMRNTAPCILLAALKIQKQNPDAVMIVAPSDHWIIDKEAFLNDVNSAFNEASKKDILVTLGIKPSFPNTGYGYIKYIEEELSLFPGYRVQKFTEKPTLRNAKKFLEDGNYLWNAGIFIWKAAAIVDSFKEHSRDMYELFGNGYDLLNEKQEVSFIEEAYPKAQNISIDYAILEKSDKVFVIPATFDWDDLGTWGALYGKLAKDTSKNAVVNADLIPLTSHGNMVYSHNNKVVILEGLENYIVVESNDVLLIVPKEKEQEIKEIRTRAIERLGEKLG